MSAFEPPSFREAVIDLGAVRENVAALRAHIGTRHTMAVVKANGYGHGAVPVARAALAGGADWLGVAEIAEALELRSAGITAPVLAWLHDPDEDFDEALAAEVAVGISTSGQLEALAAAADRQGRRARAHVKLDTGLSRNGVPREQWGEVFERARDLQGAVLVEGVFSHVSNASPDDDAAQRAAFEQGLAVAAAHGIRPPIRHLAATASAISSPENRFDMVRLGIGIYGLSPWTGTDAGVALRAAMTLRGRVANVRRVQAGAGASYDYTWRAERDTTLALVPLGYAEGVPRHASGRAEVTIAGRRHPIVGRIAMDQFIVDVGDSPVQIGDAVVLFGDPASGAPSADDWARAADTINYEIVTRVGNRVVRRYRES
ncbi:alanine racemase [Rathayibacter sp. YIM 133350]|uniref:alanine racemase n=1 Tax=Rathayibacter sp. YIM 133350 TaxID=3131992 RepID=UPI00307DC631